MECPKCHAENRDNSRFCSHCGISLGGGRLFRPIRYRCLRRRFRSSRWAGKYKIVDEISRGGMGIVYKDEDTKLKRFIALKLLPKELNRDAQAKARFGEAG